MGTEPVRGLYCGPKMIFIPPSFQKRYSPPPLTKPCVSTPTMLFLPYFIYQTVFSYILKNANVRIVPT